MKTILVTGGAGFIGTNFVRYLFEKYPNYHILVLDALTYAGNRENCADLAQGSSRYEFWHGDIRDAELVDTLVGRADVVVHMAAETHVTRSIPDSRIFFETDVIGTQIVANAVVKHRKRVERLLHISTSEVYGTALSETMDESHPLNPMSPYAAAKCGADRLIYAYWMTYDIPAVIVRPFNTYGPYQHLEKVIPRFITNCLLGEPLAIHGDGSALRDWMFVGDHCAALDRLIHVDRTTVVGEVINLGSGRHISSRDVALTICTAIDAPQVLLHMLHDRPGQVLRHTCNAAKARRQLDWEPVVSFAAGLARTISWYRAHEDWWYPQVCERHVSVAVEDGRLERL